MNSTYMGSGGLKQVFPLELTIRVCIFSSGFENIKRNPICAIYMYIYIYYILYIYILYIYTYTYTYILIYLHVLRFTQTLASAPIWHIWHPTCKMRVACVAIGTDVLVRRLVFSLAGSCGLKKVDT